MPPGHRLNPFLLIGVVILLNGLAAPTRVRGDEAGWEYFERHVRPLLAENCFGCHAEKKQEGGLRLDSRAAILAGGDSGPAAEPGADTKSADSLIMQAVEYRGLEMPPPPKRKLTKEQVRHLRNWIQMGLPWTPQAKVAESDRERRWATHWAGEWRWGLHWVHQMDPLKECHWV